MNERIAAVMPQHVPSNAQVEENGVSGFVAAIRPSSLGLTPNNGDEETDSQHPLATSAQFEGGAHLFLHSSYTSGQRLCFENNGRATSGTVDTATDDDSVVWVWLDGGGGRVMLFPGPETVITKEVPGAAKSEPEAMDSAIPCWCQAATGIYKTFA